ncbi:hypothetical protein EDB80DRAFT_446958 [Ilyonectria destructans]|nr:hypothetical protein EDB80DRAFT_446958 [Ilyonectria destructans]
MEYKAFTYSFLRNTNGASSRSINNIAYVTREGQVHSTRKYHQPFLKNFQAAALSSFDIEREDIQLISRNGTEIHVQFSPWQRFAHLSCLEGRRCRATAEFPEDTSLVRAELRKEEVITPLGIAEEL